MSTFLSVVALCCAGFAQGFAPHVHLRPAVSVASSSSSSRLRAGAAGLVASAGSALIVQNKGGGHGELGYHLANILRENDIEVTLLQDSAAKKTKEPFKSYGELESRGVEVVWADFAKGMSNVVPQKSFDYVFDNYAKDVDTCKDIAAAAKAWGVKNYVYVSSGGMYKGGDLMGMIETDAVKETGQRQVELHAQELGLPWTSFRPQYIYGPKTNKRDYLDWFFDRVMFGVKPVPLPLHGDQLTTVTHAEDVASMMASVVGNEAAVGQVFNCATNQAITYNGLLSKVAAACGVTKEDAAPRYFDPAAFDLPKGYFPFRMNHFFVSSTKAVTLLNWKPKHNVVDDLTWYADGYKAQMNKDSPPDFSKDNEINSA